MGTESPQGSLESILKCMMRGLLLKKEKKNTRIVGNSKESIIYKNPQGRM